jgi:hypothetical protein
MSLAQMLQTFTHCHHQFLLHDFANNQAGV